MPKDQTVILVDKKDKFLGYAPKIVCHTGKGKHHRAFVIALYNDKKEILLQRRKHKVFDDVWDLSAASHPLHTGKHNETYYNASARCIKREWSVTGIKFKKIGAFNYFKKYGPRCENEYCAVIIGRYGGKIKLNSKVAYGFKWQSLDKINKEIKSNPKSFAIWAKLAVKVINKGKNFGK
jgi:isopentenyl-diphosphate Delta-isomerase